MKLNLLSRALFTTAILALGARAGENVMENGDFSSDKAVFRTAATREVGEVSIVEGKSVPGKPLSGDKRVLFVDAKEAYLSLSYLGGIYVDPSRKYRVKVTVYTPDLLQLDCGGYGYAGKGGETVKSPDGKKIWQYNLISSPGPTDGWQSFETTIGPEGSDCKTIWDPKIFCIGMAIWIHRGPGKVWFSDFVVEEF